MATCSRRAAWMRNRRVRLVNDSQRSSPARYEDERGADVFRLCDLVLAAVPSAELVQRGLAVLARRHRADISHGEPAAQNSRIVAASTAASPTSEANSRCHVAASGSFAVIVSPIAPIALCSPDRGLWKDG